METSLFDFALPESLIASHPAEPRDTARMLVVGDALQDAVIRNLPSFLRLGDVIVFNDTRVIPARLFGIRGNAKVEVLLHKKSQECVWQCFARPAKRLRSGDDIRFAEGFHAEVLEKSADGQVILRFGEGLQQKLERYGHMPLPPYIHRDDNAADRERYQTVYARQDGSVAAPTAGLHFTETLLQAIDAVGAQRVSVTLHVGGGTFLPVKVEDTKDHIMHSEHAVITKETADAINRAKADGGRIIAVGTTSLRVLETAADDNGIVRPFAGETDIFITPGYRLKIVNILLTNFHLPRSTLFMLVSAFAGLERMKEAYAHAIARHYRFYSYGDACLLYRQS